jgi:hypothetical protein
MASQTEVTKILMVLVAAYPNAKIIEGGKGIPGTLEVYATMLSDIPADELLAGVKYCIINHPNFLPSIATIRDAVSKMHPTHTVSGADAWGVVLQAIREIGVYKSPHFEDPAIARAVEAFGWRNICLSDEQDFAIRSQFIKAYEAYATRIKEENELLGIPEAAKIMTQIAERKTLALETEKISH